jgi:hypothetical protein
VCDSQEAWWLRKACHRARCRLIHRLAQEFEIPIQIAQASQPSHLTLRLYAAGHSQQASHRASHCEHLLLTASSSSVSPRARASASRGPRIARPPPAPANIPRARQDIQAHHPCPLAVHTTSTVQHDLARMGADTVAVYNACTDTTRHMNGIVANLHPSEGVWLFRLFSFIQQASRQTCEWELGSPFALHVLDTTHEGFKSSKSLF